MKALFTFLCSAAVAAGILFGYLDYRAEREMTRPGLPSEAAEGSSPQATSRPRTVPAGKTTPERSRRDGLSGSPPRAPTESGPPGTGRSDPAQSDPERAAGSEELVRRIAEIRAKIQEGDFAAARELGEKAIEEGRGAPARSFKEEAFKEALEEAARLLARARAFGRIVGSLPDAASRSGASQVLLANGNVLEARDVRQEGDRVVIQLSDGGSFAPAKEDVLEVRPLAPESYLAGARQKIEARLQKSAHPVDWFLDGVQEYHQLGLEAEARSVLERILETKSRESDQVPLLFVPDADDALLRDWQVAAGRATPDLPEPEPELAASPPRGTEVDPGAGGDPAISLTSSGSLPAEGARRPPDGPLDPNELVRAAQLFAEAQVLYQGAARKEGNGGELSRARGRLDQALDILEGQPHSDETVRRLRRQIGQLLSDIARASPF